MTPRFAQHVDPIFLRVIGLLNSIESGNYPSAERERRILNDQLHNAERELSRTDRKTWELSKYALVAWIDESLRQAEDWPGRDWWLNRTMEWEHFEGSSESHEMFFVKAKEAASTPGGDDALETSYVCAMLGFRGFYGDGTQSEDVVLRAEQLDLPLDFKTWAGDVAQIIQQRHASKNSAVAEAPERAIVTAKPLWARARLLWPWMFVAALIGLNVVITYYWK